MKVSTKGTSRFLSQEDLPLDGLTAIIQDVRLETLKSGRGDEEKHVLYFTAGKPMVFNVVNRKTCVAAYGEDSDQWRGKPLEVFVDPNVYMGSERTGGIRVRIPVAKPVTPTPAKSPVKTSPTDPHAKTLAGLRAAVEASNADAWIAWGAKAQRTPAQKKEQETAHRLAIERIALTEGPAGEPELMGASAAS